MHGITSTLALALWIQDPIAGPTAAPPVAAPPVAAAPAPSAVSEPVRSEAEAAPPAAEAPPPAAAAPPPAPDTSAAAPPPGAGTPPADTADLRSLDASHPSAIAATPGAEEVGLRDPFTPPRTQPVLQRVVVRQVHAAPPPPPPEPEHKRRFIGGYGGISTRVSAVSGKLATFLGFRGGALLGDRLSLGGAYYKQTHRFGPPILDTEGREVQLRMGYGGLTMGVTVFRRGVVELGLGSLFGGGVGCITRDVESNDDDFHCIEAVRMVVVEPEAFLHVDVTSWMRLSVTGGYRAVVREPWRPPNDFRLSGGYGGLNLEFGWFGKKR